MASLSDAITLTGWPAGTPGPPFPPSVHLCDLAAKPAEPQVPLQWRRQEHGASPET